jgi:hypothetical protein
VIRYALACPDGHAFEAWFSNSDAFEAQRDGSLLLCPVCGSTSVERALMAPAVSTARGREGRGSRSSRAGEESRESRESSGSTSTAGHESTEPMRLAANVRERHEIVTAMRKLRRHLTENADYVGNKFAEEARRIHYEEAEKRGIYGEATREDARALAEEGIEFHPLPPLPEDHN